jgi:hypothetical protein
VVAYITSINQKLLEGATVDKVMKLPTTDRYSRATVIELVITLLFAIVIYFVSAQYDVLEYIVYYSDRYEALELDEVVPVMFFLVFALSVSLERRWRDLVAQNKLLIEAQSEVKQLRGIIPICAYCHKIRNDKEMWEGLERYIHQHSEAKFSHSICPECYEEEVRKLDDF